MTLFLLQACFERPNPFKWFLFFIFTFYCSLTLSSCDSFHFWPVLDRSKICSSVNISSDVITEVVFFPLLFKQDRLEHIQRPAAHRCNLLRSSCGCRFPLLPRWLPPQKPAPVPSSTSSAAAPDPRAARVRAQGIWRSVTAGLSRGETACRPQSSGHINWDSTWTLTSFSLSPHVSK